MSSRSSHTWRTVAKQLPSKTRSPFTTCLQTRWQTSRPRRRPNVCYRRDSGTQSQNAERIGVGVAKRQADIWAKRGEASDMYELDPLLGEEEACTKSAIGRLVDELAHQGHVLIRHKKCLKCRACNMYRADRQFNFWSRTRCVPRPSAADVISRFRNKKRQHINASTACSETGCSTQFHPA